MKRLKKGAGKCGGQYFSGGWWDLFISQVIMGSGLTVHSLRNGGFLGMRHFMDGGWLRRMPAHMESTKSVGL